MIIIRQIASYLFTLRVYKWIYKCVLYVCTAWCRCSTNYVHITKGNVRESKIVTKFLDTRTHVHFSFFYIYFSISWFYLSTHNQCVIFFSSEKYIKANCMTTTRSTDYISNKRWYHHYSSLTRNKVFQLHLIYFCSNVKVVHIVPRALFLMTLSKNKSEHENHC